jgi:acetyl esterase
VEWHDCVYARPAGSELLARVYQPVEAPLSGPLPVLVDVHGGGWNILDRTAGAHYDRALAAAGFVVVAVDFRMAPKHKHPTASADVAQALRWVHREAAALGADPARIGVLGSSSGGHLALLAALDLRAEPELRVRCALSLWAPVDPLARWRHAQARAQHADPALREHGRLLLSAHRAYFGSEDLMEEASVTRRVAAEPGPLPPLLLVQAGRDDNVPAAISEALLAAWPAAGGVVEHALFPDAAHGFAGAPGPDTDRCIERMCDFARRWLGEA